MKLQQKTLEKLRDLITYETEYRSGPQLVAFFNSLGGNDVYAQGFPSRWIYVDSKLTSINGTADLDRCILKLLSPVNFVGKLDHLDKILKEFNQYLAFDGWKVVRSTKDITFQKASDSDFEPQGELKEDDFLKKEFSEIPLNKLGLSDALAIVLQQRFEEIKTCIQHKAPLSVIFLCGSSLEGILLGIASDNAMRFNQAKSAAKDREGNVKPFQQWTLNNFIDVAHEVGYLNEDVKKFSHSLRIFRNYIHPYEQMSTRFNPDEHTAKISWQVLKAAIYQLSQKSS